jgi:hypothetical protein
MKPFNAGDESFTQASAVLNNTVIAALRTKPEVAGVSFEDSEPIAECIIGLLSIRHGAKQV